MKKENDITSQNHTRTLRIDGEFDFKLNRSFREFYEKAPPETQRYVIDLANTQYMDSSALGMLLLLRDYVDGDRKRVFIVNCNHEIKKIMTITNFDRLFNIS